MAEDRRHRHGRRSNRPWCRRKSGLGAGTRGSRSRSPFPVVMAGFAAFLDLYATQPLLPLLMRQFNATHFDVSLTVTAATAAVAFAAPVVGRMADIVGRKRVIVGLGDGAGRWPPRSSRHRRRSRSSCSGASCRG